MNFELSLPEKTRKSCTFQDVFHLSVPVFVLLRGREGATYHKTRSCKQLIIENNSIIQFNSRKNFICSLLHAFEEITLYNVDKSL